MVPRHHRWCSRSSCAAVVSLALCRAVQAADDPTPVERQTLEAALVLAGQSIARLPIALASVRPDKASPGVQAWTTVAPDGLGEEILVYSRSELFRCAIPSRENYQCLLKLASVVVHEAWHFRHGGSEAGAYDAQIAFLMGNQGALEQITDVRRSRARAVAAERAAIDAARKRAHSGTR